MKEAIAGGEKYAKGKKKLRGENFILFASRIGDRWSGGEIGTATATITILGILGYTCTRVCRFCDVKTSRTPPLPDPDESTKVAEGITSWGLDYNVITSVDRDDLSNQGSVHFAETVQKFKALKLNMLTEAIGTTFIHA